MGIGEAIVVELLIQGHVSNRAGGPLLCVKKVLQTSS